MQSQPYEKRRLQLLAEQTQGPRVLDVGYAAMPNPHVSEFETVGYDMAAPTEPVDGYRELIQGRAEEIGKRLAGRTFDTILCAEIIEHLEEPYDFLRQVHGLLERPGGRLLLSTPNPLGLPVIVAELLGLRKFFYEKEHTYYFLPRWMRRMLEMTGYRLVRTVPVGLWLPLAVWPVVPPALSYQNIYVAEPAN